MSRPEIVRAIVTQVTPLRVRLEGADTIALGITPDNYAGTLAVADTVLVTRYPRGQIEVLARLGGSSPVGTGYSTLSYESGYEELGTSYPVRSSLVGNRVFLSGLIHRTSGVFAADSIYDVAYITEAHRPISRKYAAGSTTTGESGVSVPIGTDGHVQFRTGPTSASYVGLEGISYAIDL